MALDLEKLLGTEARSLMEHRCKGITKEQIYPAGPNWISDIMMNSDRPVPVLKSLQQLMNHGRLAGTGYTSISLSIKELNIRRALPLLRTHCSSMQKTLLNLRLKAAPTALRAL